MIKCCFNLAQGYFLSQCMVLTMNSCTVFENIFIPKPYCEFKRARSSFTVPPMSTSMSSLISFSQEVYKRHSVGQVALQIWGEHLSYQDRKLETQKNLLIYSGTASSSFARQVNTEYRSHWCDISTDILSPQLC